MPAKNSWSDFVRNEDVRHATQQPPLSSIVKTRRLLAVSSSNHRQRSGRNLVDGHAIPGSGLLLTTWQTPTLGFRTTQQQERQLRTGSTGGCLRSTAQRTRSGACSYWISNIQSYIGTQPGICVGPFVLWAFVLHSS